MILIFCIFFFIHNSLYSDETLHNPSEDGKEPIGFIELDSGDVPNVIHVHVRQMMNQDINVLNNASANSGEDECECIHLFGKHLRECMNNLSPDKRKENFIKLKPWVAVNYLKKGSIYKLPELINLFSDEEWHQWWSQLPDSLQKDIPSTKKECILTINILKIVAKPIEIMLSILTLGLL